MSEPDQDPTPESQPPIEHSNRSGGVDFAGDAEIHGDVIGRDKVTTVSVNKNVIQIGTLVMPTVPVAIAAVLVSVVAILAGLRLLGLTDPVGPATMQGGFNVAIAEFGKEDASGQVSSSEDGQRLSRAVFDTLQAQIAEFEDKAIGSRIVVWHDSLPRTQKGTTLGRIADEAAAAELAEHIGANIVIYGNLDAQNGFTPRFYVSPKIRADIDALLIGNHQLGTQPIVVDPSDRLIAETELATRASALTYMTIGLTYDVLGRSELALNTYREAETKLTAWQERGAGKEVLYLFVGQAALFSAQRGPSQNATALIDESERAFNNAIDANPQYSKAHIGLGSVYIERAKRNPHGPDIERAFAEYNSGLDLATQHGESDVIAIAHFALGTAYYGEGDVYRKDKQFDLALMSLDQAIQNIQSALDTLQQLNLRRLTGQAYLALGLSYQQQALAYAALENIEQSRSKYLAAREAYQSCIDLGREDPDLILKDLVTNENCVPSLEQVNAKLEELGGE